MAMTEKLVFRRADATDLDLITSIEATCFPAAEAATRDQFAERLAAYGDHFWILEADGKAVGFIDGMVTNQKTISDDLFADASKHNPTGDWAAVFGLNVFPGFRRRGYAAKLVEKFIAEAKSEGRRGCILTCKEHLLHYYARFGFVNTGVSASVHGGATWYDMRLVF